MKTHIIKITRLGITLLQVTLLASIFTPAYVRAESHPHIIMLAGQVKNEPASPSKKSAAEEAYRLGWKHYLSNTPTDDDRAISYFEQAIELDPDFAPAHTGLAAAYWNSASRFWVRDSGLSTAQMMDQARVYSKRAMQSPSPLGHQISSERAAFFKRKPDEAIAEANKAITMEVSNPAGHLAMANAMLKAKRPDEAIDSMREAMRLNPRYPGSYLTRLGRAQFAQGRYEEAVTSLMRSVDLNSQDDRAFIFLAAAYGYLGLKQDAMSAIKSANRLRSENRWGNLTLEEIGRWRWLGDRKRLREGLRLAGLETGYEWHSRLIEKEGYFEIRGATSIDLQTAKRLHDAGVPFIDMSTLHVQARIPGAHNLRWGRLKEMSPREFNEIRLMEIAPKSGEIVIYHPHGSTVVDAVAATAYAVEHGFQTVYYFRDGLESWKSAGYPVAAGK